MAQSGLGLHPFQAPPLPLCLSVPKTWPRVPAHRHSAGYSLLGAISLEAAWLSLSCRTRKGRLLRPGTDWQGWRKSGAWRWQSFRAAAGVRELSTEGRLLLCGEGYGVSEGAGLVLGSYTERYSCAGLY